MDYHWLGTHDPIRQRRQQRDKIIRGKAQMLQITGKDSCTHKYVYCVCMITNYHAHARIGCKLLNSVAVGGGGGEGFDSIFGVLFLFTVKRKE